MYVGYPGTRVKNEKTRNRLAPGISFDPQHGKVRIAALDYRVNIDPITRFQWMMMMMMVQ